MAVANLSDFKIDEQLVYSLFLNRFQIASDIFNARSNGAILQTSGFVKGYFPKQSQIDETQGLVTRRDITSNRVVEDKKIVESQTGGVKVFRKIGPVAITQGAIREKQMTEADVQVAIAKMFAKQMIEDGFNMATQLLAVLIGKSAAKHLQTKAVFSPTDVLNALDFYGNFDQLWRLTVMHNKTFTAGLRKLYADKVGSISELTLVNGRLYSLGRPILKINSDNLNVADANSDVGSAQPGKWLFFLPGGSVEIRDTGMSGIVTTLIDNQEQLALRVRAEYEQVIRIKQHEWVGNTKNPTTAQLVVPASWEDRAKSHSGSLGFGVQVQDKA